MGISEQQKQQAEKLGITTSHYDIDGHLIQAKSETLDYFIQLFSSNSSSQSNKEKYNDFFVANAEEPITYEANLAKTGPNDTYKLINEQGLVVVEEKLTKQITLPALPFGYYDLILSSVDEQQHIRVFVQPKSTFHSPQLTEKKSWGINVQLYSLRSEQNWGIGDLADLRVLVENASKFGADFVGINPLHKMYIAVPDWASPYSSSSRRWLNPIYLSVQDLPEYQYTKSVQNWVKEQQNDIVTLRQQEQVQYKKVSHLKMTALEQLFAFSQRSKTAKIVERRNAFLAYFEQHQEALLSQGLFDVLDLISHKEQPELGTGYAGWRKEWQNLTEKDRQNLQKKYKKEIEFSAWLQWLTEQQLLSVTQTAQENGMAFGIYGDLAVQSSPGGSDVWEDPELFCTKASIGAPPDPLGPVGQNWGLPPYNPTALKARGFQPFIDMIRANMQYFGMLRIDHVMGLFRLWLIPEHKTAADGVYVLYPLDVLMAILAIESQRYQCMVVGEDLGTVPDEVREKLNEFQVFSYFVLYFSKVNQEFPQGKNFPPNAFATIGTHDVPSLRSFWHCKDLELFGQLGILQGEVLAEKYKQRVEDKQALLNSLHRDQYLPDYYQGDALTMAMHDHLNLVIHRYLAASHSKLVGIQLESLIDQEISFNLPGTSDEYPNWQKKLSRTLEDIFSDPKIQYFLTEIEHYRKEHKGE